VVYLVKLCELEKKIVMKYLVWKYNKKGLIAKHQVEHTNAERKILQWLQHACFF